MNYFELFDIKEQFEVDEKDLQKKYLLLQSKYHPDRANSDSEKLEFVKKAADLNNAYFTLKNAYLRAAYLLKLYHVDITSESPSIKIPAHLLNQILIKREEVEEAIGFESLILLKNRETEFKEDIIKEITINFNNKELEKTAINTMLLKYQDNLLTSINQKLEKCF